MKKFLIIFYGILVYVIYGSSLRYGFSQDDFFHFVISRASNIQEFFQFFIPQSEGWQFYRPLSTQVVYWTFGSIFGYLKAAYPMHVFMLILHTLNGYLVYNLSVDLTKKRSVSILVGGLYLVSGVHFLSLFYIGALQQLLATMASLLAIRSNLFGKRIQTVFWFIIAILSKEISLRIIPFMFILHLWQGEKPLVAIKKILVPLVTMFLYIIIRLAYGVSGESAYSLSFSPLSTLASIMWYSLMTLGFPEQILSFGLSLGQVDFSRYLTTFGVLGWVNFVSSLGVFGIFIYVILAKIRAHDWRGILGPALLYLVALSPILLLPTHRYAHYLDLSLIIFLIFIVNHLKKWGARFLFATFFVFGSLSSIQIDKSTHWTTARSEIVSRFIPILLSSNACQSHNLALVGNKEDLLQLSYALASDNGPQVLCNNFNMLVYYLGLNYSTVPADSVIINIGKSIL